MLQDKLLIVGFKQGRREALRQIYDKYKVEMLKLAVVLLGDVHTAEDVVHDVFVKFAKSAHRFKLTGSLKSYLATSVVNRVRNCRRDRLRRGEADAPPATPQTINTRLWATIGILNLPDLDRKQRLLTTA